MIGHNSRVRLNQAHANGYTELVNEADSDFGIGVLGAGTGNVVEENTVTGNTNGIILGAGSRETLVRGNTVVGNPAIQVSISHPGVRAVDILNLAPQGQTTFERNVCLTAVNAPCPVLPTGRWWH